RAQQVDDLERPFPVAVLDRRHVHQVVVALSGIVAQPAHHVAQLAGAHGDDGPAVARLGHAADRVTEGRPERVDGRIHAERNWWMELPNGSEISSTSAGGSRNPCASSGCSSRRRTASNSDSPLIFLWSSRIPYSSPSGRGGQPGTYTSTGTMVSIPCTIA